MLYVLIQFSGITSSPTFPVPPPSLPSLLQHILTTDHQKQFIKSENGSVNRIVYRRSQDAADEEVLVHYILTYIYIYIIM